MKRKILFVAALTISSTIFSQQDSIYQTLDEVVFTAGKYPRKQSETGKVITVITKEQLDQNSGKTVAEMLNTVSGTNIIGSNNSPGTNLTVSIRGSSAGNVLILLDGIPVYDPSALANYYDLNSISIDQVERIEIMKGGHSTLYGSDAVAGVINIISRKNTNKRFELTSGLQAGSFNSNKKNIGLTGNTKSLNYDLQLIHTRSDGFSSAYDSAGNKGFDRDGFDQKNVSLRLIQKINDRLQASVSGLYSTYNTDLDASAFNDDKDFTSKNTNQQINAGLTYNLPKSAYKLNYQFNNTERSYLNDSALRSDPFFYYSKSNYSGRSHFAEVYGIRKWKNNELLYGMDYRNNNTNQEYLSVSMFGPFKTDLSDTLANATQISPFTSWVHKRNNYSIELGFRWNNHSAYGNNFTYTFNPLFAISQKSKIFLNVYTAFKTPTLYQLFDPYSGNENLQAEKSNIFETGFQYTEKNLNARIVGFYRNTRNAIQYVITNPSWFTGEYQNANRQTNFGLELEAAYKTGKWNFNANYAFTKGETSSSFDASGNQLNKDTTYNGLYRIPEHAINLSAGLQLTKKLFFNAGFRWVSERLEPVYAASPAKLSPYHTINIYSEYRIHEKIKAYLDVKNLTNQTYFDVLGYNTRRFNFNTGIQIKI